METFQEKLERVLKIEDPHEAYIAASTDLELDLEELGSILEAYQKKYHVKSYEMAFYPNGERVLTPEMFQDQ